jgi:hypothetical protein
MVSKPDVHGLFDVITIVVGWSGRVSGESLLI